MLVGSRCPALPIPGSRLNDSASAINFCIGVLSPLTFCLFSENTLHMCVAPLPLFSCELTIEHLSSMVDRLLLNKSTRSQTYVVDTKYLFSNSIISHGWNLNLLICIYWNFCANVIVFLRDIEENKSGCFLLTHCVYMRVLQTLLYNLQICIVVKFLELLFFWPSISLRKNSDHVHQSVIVSKNQPNTARLHHWLTERADTGDNWITIMKLGALWAKLHATNSYHAQKKYTHTYFVRESNGIV